ncbi:hypothetical protein [Noviherbaspirillum denitrificans]|uniref:Uncharacterized protein n=1 Tax=Noviherbaspirillum denitrificans TaxID=1968433 RepID=A0A254TLC5_9BURK|nr:hypothetical protein [Noviherbaspirillum denitrificans]OWW21413.1 hypothetical protein AYR66_19920 [Noviherbaspirillum denitrificans]
MKNLHHELRRDAILELAHQARLMIVDGELCFLNDMATEKELVAFARLIERHFSEQKQGA